jgi:hypothetical protein
MSIVTYFCEKGGSIKGPKLGMKALSGLNILIFRGK